MDEIISSIKQNVITLAKKIWHPDMRTIQFHNSLKYSISNLSASYGYSGGCEWRLPDYHRKNNPERGGVVDVVWFKRASTTIVFEIDRTLKKGSVDKLLFCCANNCICFWIQYGNHTPDIFLKQRDPERRINLIRINNLTFK